MSGLFEDLAKWEEGRVGLTEVEALHPAQDVRGLVSLHVQLAAAGSVAAPDPAIAWQELRLRLPDRTAGVMDRVVQAARRPIVATAASVVLAGSAAALTSESVREAIRNFFGEIEDVLGGQEFSPPPDNEGLPVEDDDVTETPPEDDDPPADRKSKGEPNEDTPLEGSDDEGSETSRILGATPSGVDDTGEDDVVTSPEVPSFPFPPSLPPYGFPGTDDGDPGDDNGDPGDDNGAGGPKEDKPKPPKQDNPNKPPKDDDPKPPKDDEPKPPKDDDDDDEPKPPKDDEPKPPKDDDDDDDEDDDGGGGDGGGGGDDDEDDDDDDGGGGD